MVVQYTGHVNSVCITWLVYCTLKQKNNMTKTGINIIFFRKYFLEKNNLEEKKQNTRELDRKNGKEWIKHKSLKNWIKPWYWFDYHHNIIDSEYSK